eukprot:3886728-Pyramimonas_sp.AAC.1
MAAQGPAAGARAERLCAGGAVAGARIFLSLRASPAGTAATGVTIASRPRVSEGVWGDDCVTPA